MILKSPSVSSLLSKIQNAGFNEVFFLSGLAGFILGAFFFPVWQHAVEGAQAVSGLVRYPADNIFYFYQAKIWTSLHQIFALLLRLGFGERVLSIFLSGIMGMTSYQALALVTYVFSRNFTLAVFAPFFVHVTGIAAISSTYPIYLMGMMATYGTLSFMLLVLTAALLAEGRYRMGGVLLGILPSIHPAVGFLGSIMILPYFMRHVLFPSGHKDKKSIKVFFLFLGLGFFISLLSLGVHLGWTYPKALNMHGNDSSYVYSLIRALGCHREPISFWNQGFLINLVAGIFACGAICFFSRELPNSSRAFLSFVLTASILSVTAVLISRTPIESFPQILIWLMPQRILNFNCFIFGVMILGLLNFYAGKEWLFRLAAIFALGFLWMATRKHEQETLILPLFLVLSIFVMLRLGFFFMRRNRFHLQAETGEKARPELFILIVVFFIYHGSHLASNWSSRIQTLEDPKIDSVIALLHQDKSILATSPDMERIQLMTRRPVLLDLGALDMLPYVPEVGEKMFAILREVYGIRLSTEINPKANEIDFVYPNAQKLWETRHVEEWQLLAKRYHFSELLTPPNWNLQLKRLSVSSKYALYEISEP